MTQINGITGPTCSFISYPGPMKMVPIPDWHNVIADSSNLEENASKAILMRTPMIADPKIKAQLEEIAKVLMENSGTLAVYLKDESGKLFYEDEQV